MTAATTPGSEDLKAELLGALGEMQSVFADLVAALFLHLIASLSADHVEGLAGHSEQLGAFGVDDGAVPHASFAEMILDIRAGFGRTAGEFAVQLLGHFGGLSREGGGEQQRCREQ